MVKSCFVGLFFGVNRGGIIFPDVSFGKFDVIGSAILSFPILLVLFQCFQIFPSNSKIVSFDGTFLWIHFCCLAILFLDSYPLESVVKNLVSVSSGIAIRKTIDSMHILDNFKMSR